MKKLRMKSLGSYPVWLTGSRKTVWRVIYTDGESCFCIWYDRAIRVKHGSVGYITLEDY